MSKHLWEVDHPYYCSEGNFYKNGCHTQFGSWEEFAVPGGWKDADMIGNFLYEYDDDLNFLFRWDWKRADPDDYKYELEADPAFELPGDSLLLFYMSQRKGLNMSAEVAVTEADEPAVRAWLTKKAEYMRTMWEPFDMSAPEPAM